MQVVRKNSPNQYELQGEIAAIVLHATMGSYEGAVEWLMMSASERKKKTGVSSESSAHYVIGRNGEVTQLVPLNRGSWHAGIVKNPTQRAKDVLPKNINGTIKNPNRYTIGIEFAAGYDIDKDGLLETFEQLYTTAQIKAVVELILTEIEPQTKKTFYGRNILTHQDITDYKEELEKQRIMIITELEKARTQTKPDKQVVTLEAGKKYTIKAENNKIEIESAE